MSNTPKNTPVTSAKITECAKKQTNLLIPQIAQNHSHENMRTASRETVSWTEMGFLDVWTTTFPNL